MAETITYERRRPEATTLYAVVQDNLETLYGAVDDGAVQLGLPRFVKKELKYVLRPPIAQERVTQGPDGLVRIALKSASPMGRDVDPGQRFARRSSTPRPAHRRARKAPNGSPDQEALSDSDRTTVEWPHPS